MNCTYTYIHMRTRLWSLFRTLWFLKMFDYWAINKVRNKNNAIFIPNIIHGIIEKLFLIIQVSPGSDCENTTVLTTCSGSGKFLPPMVVFPGQHVQTTWKPDIPSNHKNYPWIYANKTGWMDSSTFFKWFEEFEQKARTFKKVCGFIWTFIFPFPIKWLCRVLTK